MNNIEDKYLAIVAIAKNEGRYISEWISYHLTHVADHIFLFDNQSNDNTSEIARTIEGVTVIPWETTDGLSPQFSAYNWFLKSGLNTYQWLLFIDIDEFFIKKNESIQLRDFLAAVPANIGAVAINQRVFGSSNQLSYHPDPVMQRFVWRSADDYEENKWYKSLARSASISHIGDCHRFTLRDGYLYCDSNLDLDNFDKEVRNTKIFRSENFVLHHYQLKSREEFDFKRNRGGGAEATLEQRLARFDEGYFIYRDRYTNSVFDDSSALLSL